MSQKNKFTLSLGLFCSVFLFASLICSEYEIPKTKIKSALPEIKTEDRSESDITISEIRKEDKSKIELVLYPQKKNYYIGENILIQFCLINRGKTDVTVNFGGDYRGSWRALRFKVFAVNEKGDTVADPYPSEICFGGLSADFKIASGDSFIHTIPLNYYSRITESGRYSIYAKHDLGWKESENIPTGTTVIELKMPDEQKADELLYAMFDEKKFDGGTWGKASPQYADFRSIRCPAYFPLLSKKATSGNKNALEGLGSIPTTEATEKLIDLLLDEDTTNTLAQAEIFIDRIPFPKTGENRYWDTTQRAWKIAKGWKNEFAVYSEKISARLFETENARLREIAAYILQCVGQSKNIAVVIKEMTNEIKKSKSNDLSVNMYPAPRTPLGELTETAKILIRKFSYVPTPNKSEGEDLVYILKLKTDSTFRPVGWQKNYLSFFERNLPSLTQAALEYMPTPVDEIFYDQIKKAMKGKDITSQCLSCNLLLNAKTENFKEEIFYVLKTGNDKWLLGSAMFTTYQKPFRFDALKILCSRLDDTLVMEEAIGLIKSAVVSEGSGSFGGPKTLTEAKQLKIRWQKFLTENESTIRNGKIFHIGDKEITADLFPKTYEWELGNGKRWPK
ncbi:MAG: hypothetical protein IAF38_05010 [Bacteroidia bacterium]|nr:hypothetical protein [Bacteroidia bacterium]